MEKAWIHKNVISVRASHNMKTSVQKFQVPVQYKYIGLMIIKFQTFRRTFHWQLLRTIFRIHFSKTVNLINLKWERSSNTFPLLLFSSFWHQHLLTNHVKPVRLAEQETKNQSFSKQSKSPFDFSGFFSYGTICKAETNPQLDWKYNPSTVATHLFHATGSLQIDSSSISYHEHATNCKKKRDVLWSCNLPLLKTALKTTYS